MVLHSLQPRHLGALMSNLSLFPETPLEAYFYCFEMSWYNKYMTSSQGKLRTELEIAKINAEGLWGLARQDPAKRKLVLGLILPYLLGMERGNLATATYNSLREINQAADNKTPIYGDEPLVNEPREYMVQLCAHIDGSGAVEGKYRDTRVHALVEYVLPRLQARSLPGEEGTKYYRNIVETMLFDHDRRQDRQVFDVDELDAYYKKMLDGSIDVTLLAINARARSDDLLDFGVAQGTLYTVRDLLSDWRLGIINIPRDVLTEAGVDVMATSEDMRRSTIIDEWRNDQASDATRLMQENLAVIDGLDDKRAKMMLTGLAKGAIRGAARREVFDRQSILSRDNALQ